MLFDALIRGGEKREGIQNERKFNFEKAKERLAVVVNDRNWPRKGVKKDTKQHVDWCDTYSSPILCVWLSEMDTGAHKAPETRHSSNCPTLNVAEWDIGTPPFSFSHGRDQDSICPFWRPAQIHRALWQLSTINVYLPAIHSDWILLSE